MGISPLYIVKMLSAGSAVLTGLLCAGLSFWASFQTKNEQDKFRNWVHLKWVRIENSTWLDLPEYVVTWLLNLLSHFSNRSLQLFLICRRYSQILTGAVVIAFILILTYLTMAYGKITLKIAGYSFSVQEREGTLEGLYLPLLGLQENDQTILIFLRLFGIYGSILGILLFVFRISGVALKKRVILATTLSLFYFFPYIGITFNLPIAISIPLVGLLIFPFTFVFTVFAFPEYLDAREISPVLQRAYLFFLAFVGSLILTYSGIGTGQLVSPTSPSPLTLQLFASNMIFDGLTVSGTIYLLGLSISPSKKFPVLYTSLLSLGLGLTSAVASLWLGVIGTKYHLSIQEVFRILIGLSADGKEFEFGSYFWTMHTTFIPLLSYLSILLFCWTAKATLLLSRLFLRRAQLNEINPINMTARLAGLLSAFFVTIAFVLNFIG